MKVAIDTIYADGTLVNDSPMEIKEMDDSKLVITFPRGKGLAYVIVFKSDFLKAMKVFT